jgi:hypothetical protein
MDALSLFSKYYRRIWLIVSHEHDYRTGKKIDASVAVRYRLAEDGYQESLIERSSVHLYLLERSD